MCWKTETRLGDLPPDTPLEIVRVGRPPIRTTVRHLMTAGRFSALLSIQEVEQAFGCMA